MHRRVKDGTVAFLGCVMLYAGPLIIHAVRVIFFVGFLVRGNGELVPGLLHTAETLSAHSSPSDRTLAGTVP